MQLCRFPKDTVTSASTAGQKRAVLLCEKYSFRGDIRTLTVDQYVVIIPDKFIPFMAFMFSVTDGPYQQDNALCNKSRIVQFRETF